MMSTHVPHITINTGHTCPINGSARNGREAAAIFDALLSSLLAKNGKPVPVPFFEQYAIAAWEDDDALIAQVSCVGIPLVTFIATTGCNPDSAAQQWQSLVKTATLPCRPGVPAPRMPQGPWLAVSLHLEYLFFTEMGQWVGDLEASLGWTWLEKVRAKMSTTP